jgi:bifunctional enzyme CysN/CysC
LPHFTGVDSAYEPPGDAELRIDTVSMSPEQAADAVIATLESRGLLASE